MTQSSVTLLVYVCVCVCVCVCVGGGVCACVRERDREIERERELYNCTSLAWYSSSLIIMKSTNNIIQWFNDWFGQWKQSRWSIKSESWECSVVKYTKNNPRLVHCVGTANCRIGSLTSNPHSKGRQRVSKQHTTSWVAHNIDPPPSCSSPAPGKCSISNSQSLFSSLSPSLPF